MHARLRPSPTPNSSAPTLVLSWMDSFFSLRRRMSVYISGGW